MDNQQASAAQEDASSLAMLCSMVAEGRAPAEQLSLIEALLADLTETRDDLVHRSANTQHPHGDLQDPFARLI